MYTSSLIAFVTLFAGVHSVMAEGTGPMGGAMGNSTVPPGIDISTNKGRILCPHANDYTDKTCRLIFDPEKPDQLQTIEYRPAEGVQINYNVTDTPGPGPKASFLVKSETPYFEQLVKGTGNIVAGEPGSQH